MKPKFNQSKIKLAVVSAIVAGSMGLSATSYAATTTATMTVSATVANSCSISVGAMDFGAYDQTATESLKATADVTSTCTLGGATTITISQGNTTVNDSSETSPLRQMTDGGSQFLNYNLYTDSTLASVWGNTIGTGAAVTATGSAVTTTVYGEIDPAQSVGAASFSDSVTVTLTY